MKNLVCLSLVLGALASVCLAQNEKSGWTVRGNLPPEKFVIQSHRGAGLLAPENTLEAFELGWKLGTIPEADLRVTKDGVMVAFHDANFRRTATNAPPEWLDKSVADLTFAELSKLDAGSWKGEEFRGLRIPRMADVYEVMRDRPGRWLYLDIKNVDLKQLAGEVRAHQVARQVIFTSTHYDLIRDWKKLVPESMTLNWMGGTQAALQKRLDVLRAAKFEGITQLQIHVRLNTNSASAEPFNLSRKFIRETGNELRQHGVIFQSLPWGVAEPKVYWQLLDLGVMAFATDHPDITTKAVRDYYAGARP
jgi:glycerophosphoryl diester phosphodiesterase